MERIEIQPGYSISRVIKGGWQLAGGHGHVDEQTAIEDMRQFVQAGITTFDCADIYTGVEELIGKFIRKHKDEIAAGDLGNVQIHTKYVPDHKALSTVSQVDTERIINRSLQRLGVERLDLVQFSWWDYNIPNYVETALHLVDLQRQGKIRHIGVTNFDSKRISELVEAGVTIAANQVQYSVLDNRPEYDMQALAEKFHIPFLCYGTVAGGFLSNRYLNVEDPKKPLENRSLVKYRLIIDEFGGYDLFQEALQILRSIADKYHVDIAEVACRYILQKPMVGGVIVGTRNLKHLASLQKISDFQLEDEDMDAIRAVVTKADGPKGPVFELERDREGKHGIIMKYNLNEPSI